LPAEGEIALERARVERASGELAEQALAELEHALQPDSELGEATHRRGL
jgi:hypothetical protein